MRRDSLRFAGNTCKNIVHSLALQASAAIQDFPLLGRELCGFVAEKINQATRRSLDVAKAWHQFQAFKHQPEPFLAAIVALMMVPSLSLDQACAMERVELDKSENHEGVWGSLDGLQKQLVKLLAEDPLAKPSSKTVLDRLGKSLGIPSLDAAAVQFALRKPPYPIDTLSLCLVISVCQ